ncbi:MAG: hypothetical protein AB2758_11385 [Candidatus Thiodiazotropha endolucinida]
MNSKKTADKECRSIVAKPTHTSRRADDSPTGTSPASAGPSGALLESHVGAQYLLPLLSGGEARGLPGVVVTRVAFQRTAFGHPMDDIIVSGYDSRGYPATLEIQAKRTITFTASDKIFADVVAMACQAMDKDEFKSTRYELAVAISRTSTKIEQHIQEVLKWARDYQNPIDFFRRLKQPGAANKKLEFVEVFRSHMHTAGAEYDDIAVWQLLSHLQVLAFDLEHTGSICTLLAHDRCALQLAPQDAGRASELWNTLQSIAFKVDSDGGDLDATTLRNRLTSENGYRLAGDRRLHVTRERLAEATESALSDISLHVHDVRIDRGYYADAARSALEHGRYLEILGAGGVGKSGILKDLAQQISIESRIIVIAPNRTPKGGWQALQAQLGCDANARELLTDLAGDGGGTLFIDSLDRFDDPEQQATVVDLIRAAAQVEGFYVIITARLDFDADARAWLPTNELEELHKVPSLIIGELSNEEVTWLQDKDSTLAALLRHGHPAEKLARNLFRLKRLTRNVAIENTTPFSEAQMAWQWWITGDAEDSRGRLERRRVLWSLAVHSLASSTPMDTCDSPAEAITGLTESGSLRGLSTVLVEPTHDVLRDWAIGCLLHEEPEHLATMDLEEPASMRLIRGVELAARLHVEIDGNPAAWRALLDRVSTSNNHGSWRRAVLLALARSERALESLTRCLPALSTDNEESLADLVRAAITVDSQPAAPIFTALGFDTSKLTDDFVAPQGPTWLNLITWSYAIGDHLPHTAIPQLVELYTRWCIALRGFDKWSPLLVKRLYQWLVEVEARNHPVTSSFSEYLAVKEAPGLSMTTAQENDLRTAFLSWCKLCPAEAESYLQSVTNHPQRHSLFRQLLPFIGTAPAAAPHAVTNLFLQVLTEGDNEKENQLSSIRDVFMAWDHHYYPASPARAPFLDLLQANKVEGLRLVRSVVTHAVRRRSHDRGPGDNCIEIQFPSGRRSFPWLQSYMWARSQDSYIVASALMALEAWSHLRIENGEPIQTVIDDILGSKGSPAAYLLVAIDIMLSHWPKTREHLYPFAASAELLAIDRHRFAYDTVTSNTSLTTWVHPEPASAVRLDNLLRRPSRHTPLDAVLHDYGLHGPNEMRKMMQQALHEEAAKIGAPDHNSSGMADPRIAAMRAINMLDEANYVMGVMDKDRQPTIEYVPPADEERLLTELKKKSEQNSAEIAIRGQIMRSLTEPCCSEQLLEQGVHWAKRDPLASHAHSDKDELEWIERTRLIVAALVMRDGTRDLRIAHSDWAHAELLEAAMREPDDSGYTEQLPFNESAIAAVGFMGTYRVNPEIEVLTHLLQLASKLGTGMASVLHADLAAKRPMRPELTRSLVRLGLASAIYAVPLRDDVDFNNIDDYRARQQAQKSARKEVEQKRRQNLVAAELDWHAGVSPEPSWPEMPDPSLPKVRHATLLRKSQPAQKRTPLQSGEYALAAAPAAQWLSLAVELWRATNPKLLCELVLHCWPWTAGANGVNCEPNEEPSELAFEWNNAYFAAAISAALSNDDASIEEYVYHPLAQLPEQRFLDAVEAVLHALDQLWLEQEMVSDNMAVSIREDLAKRLAATRLWHNLVSELSVSIEIHLAGAVAAMFMAKHNWGREPRCYVLPPGVARTDLLLPILTQLTEEAAGSTFVAITFLGLLEVEPNAKRLIFVARSVSAWWQVQGTNSEFWIDYKVGPRLCDWIDRAVLDVPASSTVLNSKELTEIVDILMQCGTPLAMALEKRLEARRMEDIG